MGAEAYRRVVHWVIAAVAAAMAAYHMWAIAFSPPEAWIFRSTHLAFAMVLVFLIYPLRVKDVHEQPDWLSLVLLVLALAINAYIWIRYDYLINRIPYIDAPETYDLIVGVLAILLVIEATRRVIGWALPLTALAFLAYGLLFANIEFDRLIDQLYLTTEGIYGSTLGVSAYFVLIFVLFGSFMERTGTGRLFMDFALSLTGHTAGGPGKVAVVSSSMFGTISGSAVANVMVTGSITIPLMKRTGFTPAFAGGVEATASTGGQIMPPIMGAAAFVMAEFLGVSYLQVTIWAVIPSLLFYGTLFGAVHFEAKRVGLAGVPKAECPRIGTVLRERGHLFIPVIVVLGIMVMGYSAPLAALAGTLSCFPVALLRRATREGITLATVWDAMIDGARNCLGVAMACACAGIVIGIIALTGLGITFTQLVLALAQETLILALIVTAMAGIILGMGMPTTPAYIIMVALLVPAVARLLEPVYAGLGFGAIEMRAPAHLFAFYFAIMSAITPPVALAVFAAAGIAKADLWRTGWAAVRIGAAGFIVPFMFVYEPALLMIGSWPAIIQASATAAAGCLLLAGGLNGYLLRKTVIWESVVLIGAGLCLIKPGLYTDIAGFGGAAAVAAWQYATRRSVQAA